MRTPSQWQADLDKRGLSAFAPLVIQHLQPCVRFSLEKAGEYDLLSHEVDDQTAIGSSKLGGYPDAPSGFVWPSIDDAITGERVALPFLVQVRLADVAALDEENALPHTGLLSFFFDFTFINEHGGRVLYFEEDSVSLERHPAPANIVAHTDSHYFPGIESPYQLGFERSDSIPVVTAFEVEEPFTRLAAENGITKTSELYPLMDAYNALCFGDGETPAHQLLGCEAIDYGRASAASWWQGLHNPELAGEDAEEDEIRRWRLLLQVDNDERVGFNIGSGSGVIAFYIREDNLKRADFSNVFGTYLK